MSVFNTIKRRLRPALAGLAAAAALAGTIGIAPAHAEWLRAESPHFIIYGDSSEGALRSYARKVERFDSVLRLYYPIANEHSGPKLEIYLAKGLDDLQRIDPQIGGAIAGFYSASDQRIYAVADTSRSEDDSTLFHEYGHHFMLANMSNAYPGWFIEGFAEYYATADLTPGRVQIGGFSPGRMNSLNIGANQWVPMDIVLGSRTSQLRGTQGYSYYAQSWALMSYLMSTPERQQQLGRYLAAIVNGADPIAALQGTIDRTPDQLQGDVRRYLYQIQAFTLLQPLPEAEVTISRMAPGARDLVWLDLRMDRALGAVAAKRAREAGEASLDDDEEDEDETRDAARLARARARAEVLRTEGVSLARTMPGRYPDNRLAKVVAAKAEMVVGEWAAAERLLGPLVADGMTDAEALRLTAISVMARADANGVDPEERMALYGDARRLLSRAYQAGPDDFRTYLALNESRQGAPGYPNENDLNTLLAASELAPQVSSTRFRAAEALISHDIYQQAIDLLAPIANDPHGGSSNQRVRALLDEARAKAGLAPQAVAAPPEAPAPAAAEGEEAAPPAA